MAYYVGDIPAEDIVIDPARDGEPIDLAPFDELDSTVELRTFEGDVVDADFLITFDGDPVDQIVLEWPATTVFATPGLYTLTVTLIGDTAREKLAPVYIVAQEDNGWHTLDSARDESLEAIGEAIEANGKVIVTGCLGAEPEVIQKAHPKVLAVTVTDNG